MSFSNNRQIDREVAHRIFAAEFDDSTETYSESDEERAPNYVISPTGALLNRLFVVGTLTEVDRINDEMVRARVVDPTGAFVIYAGQYQPDALAVLEEVDVPRFVAVTGKARTFEPEDGDQIYTSIRPERVSVVEAGTRDRWVVDTAERTLERIDAYSDAIDHEEDDERIRMILRERGLPDNHARGISLAQDRYRPSESYLSALRSVSIDAVRIVAGEIDEMESTSPTLERAADVDVSPEPVESEPTGSIDGSDSTQVTDEPTLDESAPTDLETTVESSDRAASEGSSNVDNTTEETEPASDSEELGEFDADTGMYDMEDDEREEIEEEFGTEFNTGSDIEEPEIETNSKAEAPQEDANAGEVTESNTSNESITSDDDEDDEEEIVDTVVAVMERLDEGDGVARSAVVETVVSEHEVREESADDAVNEALMEGRCYEPEPDTLKPI